MVQLNWLVHGTGIAQNSKVRGKCDTRNALEASRANEIASVLHLV